MWPPVLIVVYIDQNIFIDGLVEDIRMKGGYSDPRKWRRIEQTSQRRVACDSVSGPLQVLFQLNIHPLLEWYLDGERRMKRSQRAHLVCRLKCSGWGIQKVSVEVYYCDFFPTCSVIAYCRFLLSSTLNIPLRFFFLRHVLITSSCKCSHGQYSHDFDSFLHFLCIPPIAPVYIALSCVAPFRVSPHFLTLVLPNFITWFPFYSLKRFIYLYIVRPKLYTQILVWINSVQ